MTCKQVEVLGNPPSSLKVETGYVETYEKGFVLQSPNKSLALLNDPQKPRFDVWTLDEENPLIPPKRISTSELIPESKNWMMFRVINVACLSPQTALVAITYDNPRPEVRLYVYNLFDNKFNLLADAESHGQDSSKYYDHKVLNEKESLVIYYSDTKRQSSEIYHNYYNHILLFSEQYPQGLEIVKLGIDIGNIVDWHVTDKTLFLHTRDNRGKGTAKVNYWSLDLSKLITK
jgi:hypothetical protein